MIADRIATSKEPKQMEPSDVVVARLKDADVGERGSAKNHHVAATPAVVTWTIFFKTSAVL